MVARFHYDDSVYQQLLADQLPADDQGKMAAHVEVCEDCQSKLEAISQVDIRWDDVRQFLSRDGETNEDLRDTMGDERSGSEAQLAGVGFLQPTDCADSLGKFGRYEIQEILGRGGMGVVLRGYDSALGRHSAIKVLAPELATHAVARKRFSREAKSAAAVVHEHVVPILTVDEEQGLPYLVMPVVEGRSLEQRVAQHGPLETNEILRIGSQIALGLAAAHAQGLVHRDVKPANILLENGVERVMITDFGLARAADDASMTRSGVIAGTPQYMSPEQSRGADIDCRSDLFSLGSVLYFMCTGRSPYRAETTMGVLHRIVNDDPRSIQAINPDVPVWLQSIIQRMLQKDADDRYQSAEEVADVLGGWLAHRQQPEHVPPPQRIVAGQPKPKRPLRKWLAGAVLGLLSVCAAVVIVLEIGKGTITIESQQANVPIRIRKGEQVVQRLTVRQGKGSTRIAAGEYVVEVDGDYDEIEVKDGRVTLPGGGEVLVRVIEKRMNPQNEAGVDEMMDAIGKFNADRLADTPDHGQPPLTDNELIASLRWELREPSDKMTPEQVAGMQQVVKDRMLPNGWSIQGGLRVTNVDGEQVRFWLIGLSDNGTRKGKPTVRSMFHTIRRRMLKVDDRDDATAKDDDDPGAMPLAVAIGQFNRSHRTIDGIRQPPLTEAEVVAAILDWKLRRDDAPVANQDFARLQRIAQTRSLPKDTKFEILAHFQPGDGATYSIWSVRILMPKSDPKGWTYAFTIREQFISVTSPKESEIHWGPPAKNGLQVGVRLSPANEEYTLGQEIKTEFFFRAILGKSLKGSLPNAFTHKSVEVLDPTGKPMVVEDLKIEMTIGGWMVTEFGEHAISRNGVSIVVRDPDTSDSDDRLSETLAIFDNGGTAIYARPGQSCRMRFEINNYAENSDEPLKTGEVIFRVTQDTTP